MGAAVIQWAHNLKQATVSRGLSAIIASSTCWQQRSQAGQISNTTRPFKNIIGRHEIKSVIEKGDDNSDHGSVNYSRTRDTNRVLTARCGRRSNIAVSTALSRDEDQRDDRERQLNTPEILLRADTRRSCQRTCRGALKGTG